MSEPKLCPYRTFVEFEVPGDLGTDKTAYQFAPCLQDKCAMWRRVAVGLDPNDPEQMARVYDSWCGLAGKP